jgi:hypothetical protein
MMAREIMGCRLIRSKAGFATMNIAALRFPLTILLLMSACTNPPPSADNPQSGNPQAPQTVAELSGGTRTSTYAEVVTFLDALQTLPHANKLSVSDFGTSFEGKAMKLVVVADPPLTSAADVMASGKMRILVNANIHAGEVEGKAAVQMILREFALGEHADLLENTVIMFVPIYNADGNDRIDPQNRVTQNGPDEGVGIRPNAQGLDLNRDFLKAEAPETRAMLGLMRDFDPHLFMDLHTTNGSYHGYHLTYAPSLSTNVDAAIDNFNRGVFLPEVRQQMLVHHDLRIFDYGNFSGEGEAREWNTYDHRPRFGTNYVGLRNRLSVLSEAYSCLDLPTRIHATHAFVLEVLAAAGRNHERIQALAASSDKRAQENELSLGFETELGAAVEETLLVGAVENVVLPNDLGVRHAALPEVHATIMGVRRGFESKAQLPYPSAWVLPQPTAQMRELLELHGVRFEEVTQARQVEAQVFLPTKVHREENLFQGHHELSLRGSWHFVPRTLPIGALIVPSQQPLARVAAQLLEPQSEDSASTWDKLTGWETAIACDSSSIPVWRLPK